MNDTPSANRKHIVFYGKTNSGKSSLMNSVVNQNMSLVSEKPGTTTDPIQKAVELLPYGPVLFIDTAGLFDNTELGDLRVNKTLEMLKRTDLGIYVTDGTSEELEKYDVWKKNFEVYHIPHLLVINKIDIMSQEKIRALKRLYKDAVFTVAKNDVGIEELRKKIILYLDKSDEDISIIEGLVSENGKVIMVVPVDSEAPKGRLILPQVQCIRDCLDHGIKVYVVRDKELKGAIEDIKNVDLVITDSQVFKIVDKIIPDEIKLTSFSILFARQKGDIGTFLEGVNKIRNLKIGDKVLMAESCSHNTSHEDIGKYKIPKLLNEYVGGNLNYDFTSGHDFPRNIEKYDLVIHCGGCMMNRRTMINRINFCEEKKVPITNYGIVLAFLTGILDRATSISNL